MHCTPLGIPQHVVAGTPRSRDVSLLEATRLFHFCCSPLLPLLELQSPSRTLSSPCCIGMHHRSCSVQFEPGCKTRSVAGTEVEFVHAVSAGGSVKFLPAV